MNHWDDDHHTSDAEIIVIKCVECNIKLYRYIVSNCTMVSVVGTGIAII